MKKLLEMLNYLIFYKGGIKKPIRVNSIGYDEKYVIYTCFELTRRVICVSNTKLGFKILEFYNGN